MGSLIDDIKDSSDTWKIYLFVKIICRFLRENGEEREILLNNRNVLVMSVDSRVDIINAIFQFLHAIYHEKMVENMRVN